MIASPQTTNNASPAMVESDEERAKDPAMRVLASTHSHEEWLSMIEMARFLRRQPLPDEVPL
jgi:hypothetical protein